MRVCAVIPTRGDVDMRPVIDSLPADWDILVWENGKCLHIWQAGVREEGPPHPPAPPGNWPDLSVYARYAAILHTSCELVYTQDDDVIVSDPQAILDAWKRKHDDSCSCRAWNDTGRGCARCDPTHECYAEHVVCNMPQEFRHDGYTDSALVGFGAAFHRDAPLRAFERYWQHVGPANFPYNGYPSIFNRTCDVVFTTLTPRVLVDVPKTDREFASSPTRMWKQPDHYGERVRMLELSRKVRDA